LRRKIVDFLTATFEHLLLLDDRRLNSRRDQRGFILHRVGRRGLVCLFGWCNESAAAAIAFTA
jgi:hypothetical protein